MFIGLANYSDKIINKEGTNEQANSLETHRAEVASPFGSVLSCLTMDDVNNWIHRSCGKSLHPLTWVVHDPWWLLTTTWTRWTGQGSLCNGWHQKVCFGLEEGREGEVAILTPSSEGEAAWELPHWTGDTFPPLWWCRSVYFSVRASRHCISSF